MKSQRTHDKFYLNENYKDTPKEYFKFLHKEILEDNNLKSDSQFTLLDIGCETGSFLYYIRKLYPNSELTGMDIMKELLSHVNDRLPSNSIKTVLADISNKETLLNEKYDIVTMSGVLSIFDNYKEVIYNALDFVKEGKTLYIFGIFNPKNVDVLIKTKNPDKEDDLWEKGWNYISQKSIVNLCNKMNVGCEFIPFKIDMDIKEHTDDPLRSWTIKMEGGGKKKKE